MNAYRNVSFVGFVIMAVGIVLGIYGFSFYEEKTDLFDNGIKTKGEVIEISENAIYRSPIVRFTTEEGREITFLSKYEVALDFFKYKVGDQIDVVYHRDDPNNCEVDGTFENHFLHTYVIGFGVFLLLLGFWIRRHYSRKADELDARG